MKKERKEFLNMVIYQVYPRSFKDSNGDGIGDLNGVIEKLDYLCDLGINTIWLSPCYKSPNYDNGYDISDYRDVMDEFGTLQDLKRLISEMHARGMKLLMDLVVNHTSYQHKWFQEAKKSRDNPYHDYYIWAEKPFNDWQSVFGGTAWEYNKETDEYYLHSFSVQQPDLNWENPKVRQECCDIVDYWVNFGVDGFRCDVLDYISKDFQENKMYNGAKLHEYIHQLFGREKARHLFTIGECQSDEKSIGDICGENRGELTTVFQFDHIHHGRRGRWIKMPFRYDDIRETLVKWQQFSIDNDLLYMLFTDNHDQPFYLSRLGNDKEYRYECATMYATMFYLLRGIPLIYQGQEFGLVNSVMDSVEDFDDVETLRYYHKMKEKKDLCELLSEMNFGSRDNTRHPVAWTDDKTTCYGFSTGKFWLKPCTRAEEINLQTDKKSEKSVFAFYKKLLAFRKENEGIRQGDFYDLTQGDGYFAYKRTLKECAVVVICNFEKDSKIFLPLDMSQYRYAFGNYKDRKGYDKPFRPFEAAVYFKQ